MSEVNCPLDTPRHTHMPPQTLFEEKLLTLLIADRARCLYYEDFCRRQRHLSGLDRFEDLPGEERDRWYGEARTLLYASL